jgi:FMN phosphatase YigB (HAD superfamily)
MDTFLFDLDGTLLSLDMKLFEKLYFESMTNNFIDLIEPKQLVSIIMASTKVMIENIENRTNEDVFMEDFGKRINGDLSTYQERFNNYYSTDFHRVKESTAEVQSMNYCIKLLKSKGYNLVVATNPLFPKSAIHTRIQWAGFEPEDFDYISTFETNHYCKPQIKYYEEVLRDINKSPEKCIMVGNDVQEDLIVKSLGVKTYLITNNILHRTDSEIITDYKGNYEDFFEFVKALPEVKPL